MENPTKREVYSIVFELPVYLTRFRKARKGCLGYRQISSKGDGCMEKINDGFCCHSYR